MTLVKVLKEPILIASARAKEGLRKVRIHRYDSRDFYLAALVLDNSKFPGDSGDR